MSNVKVFRTNRRTDKQTDRPKTICPQIFDSGGIKTHETDLHQEHLHHTYKNHILVVNNKNTKLFRSTEHDTALPDIIVHCEMKNCNMHRPIYSTYVERSNELNMKGAEEFFNTKNSQFKETN